MGDLCAPDLADLQLVADELGLHTLAVEDAASGRQRPKFSRYTGHDFLTAYAVQLDVGTGELVTGEIAAFITAHALVTVRKDDDFPIEGLLGRWDDNTDLIEYGVGALVHGLLDYVVDGHFDAVQSLDDQIEELEDLSSTTAHTTETSSAAASSYARVWSDSGGLCCRCARCSTR